MDGSYQQSLITNASDALVRFAQNDMTGLGIAHASAALKRQVTGGVDGSLCGKKPLPIGLGPCALVALRAERENERSDSIALRCLPLPNVIAAGGLLDTVALGLLDDTARKPAGVLLKPLLHSVAVRGLEERRLSGARKLRDLIQSKFWSAMGGAVICVVDPLLRSFEDPTPRRLQSLTISCRWLKAALTPEGTLPVRVANAIGKKARPYEGSFGSWGRGHRILSEPRFQGPARAALF